MYPVDFIVILHNISSTIIRHTITRSNSNLVLIISINLQRRGAYPRREITAPMSLTNYVFNVNSLGLPTSF